MEPQELKEFQAGTDLTSQEFLGQLNDLVRACKSNFISKGIGYDFNRSESGTSLSISTQRRSTSVTEAKPFEVTLSGNADDGYEATVVTGSLMYSLVPSEKMTITGLNTPTAVVSGDFITLEVDVASYYPTSATLVFGSDFDPTAAIWTTNSTLEDDGDPDYPQQNKARLLIAYITQNGDFLAVNQCVKDELLLTNITAGGYAAIYPMPFFSPYIAPV